MTVFDRIKELSQKHGKSVSKVAIDLGFSENLFYRWKTSEPKARDLEKVADYFNVSVDSLLGREDASPTKDDGFAEFFKMETSGMTDEEKATLEKEWKDYLIIRKRMMRGE